MNQVNRLKQIIKESGLNQEKFASSMNTAQSTISRYLAGRTLDTEFIKALSVTYDVNPTWLLTGQGKKKYSDAVIDNFKIVADEREYEEIFNELPKFLQDIVTNAKPFKTPIIDTPNERIDERGNITIKSKKAGDSISLDGLTEGQKKIIQSMLEEFQAAKGNKKGK